MKTRANAGVFDWVVAQLTGEGAITTRERLALAGHRVELSADEVHA